jgi:hypothetical protein
MSRIQRYEASEIRFNLLAIVGDKKAIADKEINRLRYVRSQIQKQLGLEVSDMVDEG